MTTPVERLAEFISASPSPFHAALNGSRMLDDAGFERLTNFSTQEIPAAGYALQGGALVAWKSPGGPPARGYRLIGAHTDSPNLRVRPMTPADDQRVHVAAEPYGGVLFNSWLNRDLGLSGRISVADPGSPGGFVNRLVLIDRPVATLPQLAVHLDRGVNEGLALNPQTQLNPIFSFGDEANFGEWLVQETCESGERILAAELMFHDLAAPSLIGANSEMFAAPRLDNLCSCFGALEAIISTDADHPTVIALFDHEEVGSETSTGARSELVAQVIDKLMARGDVNPGDGRVLSADMAHGFNANYEDSHDPRYQIRCGGGPAVKFNAKQRYATNSLGAAEFMGACEAAGIEYQSYTNRADAGCGSTIGPAISAALGATTVDVGVPQLSMHSARELMAASDVEAMGSAFTAWLATPVEPLG